MQSNRDAKDALILITRFWKFDYRLIVKCQPDRVLQQGKYTTVYYNTQWMNTKYATLHFGMDTLYYGCKRPKRKPMTYVFEHMNWSIMWLVCCK